jgi:hypothetical protein
MSVAASRDRGICRSLMLVGPSNDKISSTERPLDRRQASIHVVLSQPIRRIYEKPFRSSPAFGSRRDLLNGYSRGNR